MRKIAILLALLLASPASAQIVNTLPFQLQNGTTADATQVMADFNQIVNNANSNAAKNGANSDITSLSGLTTPLSPAQGGSSVYVGGTSGGAANAQTVTATPNGFTLAAGKRIVFIAGFTNTGPTTLSVSGATATNVFYPTPSGPLPLVGGEIVSGNIIEAWFDGTQYQLITNNLALLGPLTNIASATTTDLGTVPTHNVNVTGTTTITSFGATASAAYPIYYLTFVGSLTLTYNQTSCSTTGGCIAMPGAANIVTQDGDTAVLQYNGAGSLGGGNWTVAFYQRASGTSVVAATPLCGANGLTIANNTGTPNTNIDYSASSTVMVNSSGASITAPAIAGTINTTNIGVVNGIQASRTNGIWYDIYFISNGSTNGGFAVAHGTSLSAPSGYQYSCYMGQMQTDSSSNFFLTTQRGNIGHWVGGNQTGQFPCQIATGVIGTYSTTSPTLTATAVTGNGTCAPATATGVNVIVNPDWKGNSGASLLAAPSSSYSGSNNGPQGTNGRAFPIWAGVTGSGVTAWIYLESANLYLASNATGGSFWVADWKDAVNAN